MTTKKNNKSVTLRVPQALHEWFATYALVRYPDDRRGTSKALRLALQEFRSHHFADVPNLEMQDNVLHGHSEMQDNVLHEGQNLLDNVRQSDKMSQKGPKLSYNVRHFRKGHPATRARDLTNQPSNQPKDLAWMDQPESRAQVTALASVGAIVVIWAKVSSTPGSLLLPCGSVANESRDTLKAAIKLIPDMAVWTNGIVLADKLLRNPRHGLHRCGVYNLLRMCSRPGSRPGKPIKPLFIQGISSGDFTNWILEDPMASRGGGVEQAMNEESSEGAGLFDKFDPFEPWGEVLQILRENTRSHLYNHWMRTLTAVTIGNRVLVVATSEAQAAWTRSHFMTDIEGAVGLVTGTSMVVEVAYDESKTHTHTARG